MKYDGWPIATFIENELRDAKLLSVASTLKRTADIRVAFYRDAWRFQSRQTPSRLCEAALSGCVDAPNLRYPRSIRSLCPLCATLW